MKVYSVSLPVYASVCVLVEAENEERALELAERCASLSESEPIDFSQDESAIDITECVDESGLNEKIWIAKNKYRMPKR